MSRRPLSLTCLQNQRPRRRGRRGVWTRGRVLFYYPFFTAIHISSLPSIHICFDVSYPRNKPCRY